MTAKSTWTGLASAGSGREKRDRSNLEALSIDTGNPAEALTGKISPTPNADSKKKGASRKGTLRNAEV